MRHSGHFLQLGVGALRIRRVLCLIELIGWEQRSEHQQGEGGLQREAAGGAEAGT